LEVLHESIPLLAHPLKTPAAFTPEGLISAVRIERGLACEPVPPVCILEFDGDLTDWLVSSGVALPWKSWACFHTTMYSVVVDGTPCGVVPKTIGGPYAVLIAEQLRASGARLILGLTSAGRVSGSLPVPSLVVPAEAIRDEGTSYHYLPASPSVSADVDLAACLATGLQGLGLPVSRGSVWTTDAPYRETNSQLAKYSEQGVLAVEMQAASLFAFAIARGMPVGMVAHVTNAVDHDQDPFNKGSRTFGWRLIETMCRTVGEVETAFHGGTEMLDRPRQ
jgi:uridine phosphorylase